MSVKLKAVSRTQGNNRALKNRTVQPDRVDLEFEEVPVLVDAFRRMVRGLEFDVCEMAFTTYLCAKAHGKRFTAIPVFLVRAFHHTALTCAASGPVGRPEALEGRRVGVNRGYTVTTSVWARGILADLYGVDLNAVTWAPSGDDHVAEYIPPNNVERLPAGSNVQDLVAEGELVAGVGIEPDRPQLAYLLPDAEEAGYRSLQDRGLYPINHLVVIRDDLLAKHPHVARDLFAAFAESKRLYVDRLRRGELGELSPADHMYRRVMEMTGSDPLPYGVEPNRDMIETLLRYAVSQQILDERPSVEDLFAPGTLDLVG